MVVEEGYACAEPRYLCPASLAFLVASTGLCGLDAQRHVGELWLGGSA